MSRVTKKKSEQWLSKLSQRGAYRSGVNLHSERVLIKKERNAMLARPDLTPKHRTNKPPVWSERGIEEDKEEVCILYTD